MFVSVVEPLSKKVDVKRMKTFLRVFRCPKTGKQYVSPQLYKHCKSTSEVLLSLEPMLINVMHPYLLHKIIEHFGCDESKQAMNRYDEMLPRTIALKHLGDPIPEWMIAACHGSKKIIVVVKGESDTITRGDVEDIQVALGRVLEVDQVFIVFAKQEPRNSVALTFLLPECVSVVGSLRNDGQKLIDLAASGIMTIEAEGDTIEVEVEGKLWNDGQKLMDLAASGIMTIEAECDTIEVEVEGKLWMPRMMRMKDSDELSVDSGFGGSVISSRRSSFSEEVPSDAPTREDEEALKFAADLTANRTAPSRK